MADKSSKLRIPVATGLYSNNIYVMVMMMVLVSARMIFAMETNNKEPLNCAGGRGGFQEGPGVDYEGPEGHLLCNMIIWSRSAFHQLLNRFPSRPRSEKSIQHPHITSELLK